jgi:hypothetical protein
LATPRTVFSSGMYLLIGSESETLPASICCSRATPATGLVDDIITNSASGRIGTLAPWSSVPWAWKWTSLLRRATAVTPPVIWFLAM